MKKLLLLILLTSNVYAKSDVITKITAEGSGRHFTDKVMKELKNYKHDDEAIIDTTNGFDGRVTSFELDLTTTEGINFKMSGNDNYQLSCPRMSFKDKKNKTMDQQLVDPEHRKVVINALCFMKDETGKNVELAVEIFYENLEYPGFSKHENFYVWIKNPKYKDSNFLYYGEPLIK